MWIPYTHEELEVAAYFLWRLRMNGEHTGSHGQLDDWLLAERTVVGQREDA